jgi:hypothetical protein
MDAEDYAVLVPETKHLLMDNLLSVGKNKK